MVETISYGWDFNFGVFREKWDDFYFIQWSISLFKNLRVVLMWKDPKDHGGYEYIFFSSAILSSPNF